MKVSSKKFVLGSRKKPNICINLECFSFERLSKYVLIAIVHRRTAKQYGNSNRPPTNLLLFPCRLSKSEDKSKSIHEVQVSHSFILHFNTRFFLFCLKRKFSMCVSFRSERRDRCICLLLRARHIKGNFFIF